jgi:hypothetical protein
LRQAGLTCSSKFCYLYCVWCWGQDVVSNSRPIANIAVSGKAKKMTTKMKKELIGLIIICFALGQCTSKKSDVGAEKDEDYKSFIKTFNEDTVFQKTRVKYKFEEKFNLSLSNVDTKLFDISTVESDSVVVKMTLRTDTTYWVKYIFKKDGSKWYLTDYVDTYRE